MTEDCFRAGALNFADNVTTIRYTDGSAPEFTIPAVDVTEGVVPKGSTWRRDPIPACACDGGCSCHWDPNGQSGELLLESLVFVAREGDPLDGGTASRFGLAVPVWCTKYIYCRVRLTSSR